MNEIESVRLAAIYCLGCPEMTKEQGRCLESFILNPDRILCLEAMEALRQIGPFWAFRLICCIIGADNPFDEKVVKTYWLSGEALRPSTDSEWVKVHREFREQMLNRSMVRSERQLIVLKTEEMLYRLKGVKPHHNFSVVRTLSGVSKNEKLINPMLLETANSCLVRPARITVVDKDNLEVETERIVWRGSMLFVERTNERVTKGFTEDPHPGKYVSLHLGLDRQELTFEQAKSISDITKEAIDSVMVDI